MLIYDRLQKNLQFFNSLPLKINTPSRRAARRFTDFLTFELPLLLLLKNIISYIDTAKICGEWLLPTEAALRKE